MAQDPKLRYIQIRFSREQMDESKKTGVETMRELIPDILGPLKTCLEGDPIPKDEKNGLWWVRIAEGLKFSAEDKKALMKYWYGFTTDPSVTLPE